MLFFLNRYSLTHVSPIFSKGRHVDGQKVAVSSVGTERWSQPQFVNVLTCPCVVSNSLRSIPSFSAPMHPSKRQTKVSGDIWKSNPSSWEGSGFAPPKKLLEASRHHGIATEKSRNICHWLAPTILPAEPGAPSS
jgi:hypothetical protein